ncbi:LolA family protein [Rhodobaculum claviforme]|uniref:Cell envelope biogenesis protein LolA n=1 Tax=Rhodobaculum claviforme TaxID=1549854 RepID=A0A934TL48_9RHOB|nr:outer membrane lipoprotein carrier protein LolA [Rhodobaculum claviforme]MBK5927847.1 cell envelope biogenesis protein LolA [Rhodobaculum claviforme]
MDRRTLLLAPLAWAALGRPAAAAPIPLGEISRYFNAIQTAQAEFTQVNPDGSLSTGQLWIRRPGRMRFEYDSPDNSLVIAASGTVAVFDRKSNTGPAQYPLSRTPLSLILAPRVDLTQARMVVAHRQDGDTTVVVAQDPDRPEHGTLQLVFTAAPTELRQWRVTDDAGRETTVVLGQLRTGMTVPNRLFDLAAEAPQQGR